MNKIIRMPIRINSTNKQISFSPKKKEFPESIRVKMEKSKFLRIKLKEMEFE